MSENHFTFPLVQK